jgi:hypothetical protein
LRGKIRVPSDALTLHTGTARVQSQAVALMPIITIVASRLARIGLKSDRDSDSKAGTIRRPNYLNNPGFESGARSRLNLCQGDT